MAAVVIADQFGEVAVALLEELAAMLPGETAVALLGDVFGMIEMMVAAPVGGKVLPIVATFGGMLETALGRPMVLVESHMSAEPPKRDASATYQDFAIPPVMWVCSLDSPQLSSPLPHCRHLIQLEERIPQ